VLFGRQRAATPLQLEESLAVELLMGVAICRFHVTCARSAGL
jgi:hypothetical protein